MVLRDRKQLAKLMVIQGVSGRQLSAAAGYASHTYVQRLLRGEVLSLRADPARRIARHLGVETTDLFIGASTINPGRSLQSDGMAVSA